MVLKKCIFGMDTLDAISADRILYICSFQTTLACFAKLRPVKFISTQGRLNQHTFTKILTQYLFDYICRDSYKLNPKLYHTGPPPHLRKFLPILPSIPKIKETSLS